MTLLVRGINPVWNFVDLVGQEMDDTFYFFTLQNTLPYLPSPVYQDQSGSVPWSNPIQLLANGTLPVNIYFDPTQTYRLEWRNGPTQADALIYLVENYIPDGTASISPVAVTPTSQNQITDPQFSLVNFTSPITINSATTTSIAPGWDIITTGAGSLVVSQIGQGGNVWTANNATNAPYYLSMANAGFSTVTLRQRFNGNGALFTGSFVALNFTAWAANATTLTDSIKYSDVTSVIFSPASLTTVATDFRRSSSVPVSTSGDLPPVAWTEVDFTFTDNTTVNITSIQVVSEGTLQDVNYIQTTPDQATQGDTSSPIGTIIDYAGNTVPPNYLLCDGTSVLRATYPALFAAIGVLWGSVDGTHFTLPALQGYATAGAGAGAPLAPLNAAIGSYVGANSITMIAANIAQHTHNVTVPVQGVGGGFGYAAGTATGTGTFTTNSGNAPISATPTPMVVVQPTAIVNKLIRYQ